MASYTSLRWLYSLSYPSDWYSLPNFGAPDNDKYFSNEKTAEAPMDLGVDGIWLTVRVTLDPTRQCSASGMINPSVAQNAVTVDGLATTKYTAQTSVVVKLQHAAWCYSFTFSTNYAGALTAHYADIDVVLSSFRFNR